MAPAANSYKKLRGTGGGVFEYSQLYLAPDHLLQVTSTGYSESYRRFFFRDIKAFTIRGTQIGRIFNALFAALALLFLAIGLQSGATIAWGIVALFFLLLLAVNTARGPTCVCHIHTAVQARQLGSLKRLRRARRFLEQIKPQITASQGALPPEEIARRVEQLRQSGFYTEAAPTSPEAGPAEP